MNYRTDSMQELLAEVNRQLDARGLILRTGTLVDATLIQAAARPGKSDGTKPSADPDASWGGKTKALKFGYKGHIGMDEGSELIRRAEPTPANDHDNTQLKAMISGGELCPAATITSLDGRRNRPANPKKSILGRIFEVMR